jgi:cell division protein FtsB
VSGFARRWWLLLALLALLLGLQSKLWLGERGLPDARDLRHGVEQQRAENARLQQRNDALSAEVEDLKSGEAAVEERARSELGMVKPGETFYRVVEPHSASSVAQPPAGGLPAATPNADAVPAAPATSAPAEVAPATEGTPP